MLVPTASLDETPPLDTIIVPGGAVLREGAVDPQITSWLRERIDSTRRVTSVCTGVYGLAAAGLLDGRRATTHWRFLADFRRRFPAIEVEEGVIFVKDGNLYSSGGICAGIDLALALVAEDLGPSVSLAIAREMVVQSVRAGSQTQFSALMQAQARAPRRLADLVAWIAGHLEEDLSVAGAGRAGGGERAPARPAVPRRARRKPGHFRGAAAAGGGARRAEQHRHAGRGDCEDGRYRSGDAFSRAFARAHGASPLHYRQARMSEIVG